MYGDVRRLYLNVTNRCTNRCSFCVRYKTEGLGGSVLWGGMEPDLAMLQASVLARGDFEKFREIVWCGYGEPTYRLDLIGQAASWLRRCGAKIRLNTNGHACLIHGRDVLPELGKAVDAVSVSLNAPNARRYEELCRPDAGSIPNPGGKARPELLAWDAMLDFLWRAPVYFENVQASVVGFTLSTEEIESCRLLARSLGVKQFRVR
ncbi:MAG: radical SAM protein [Acidobacteria bacterium]|nr:radical SAM protein [Acidobacteriota bacterium]